jgi:hypothetical protein
LRDSVQRENSLGLTGGWPFAPTRPKKAREPSRAE